MAQQHLHIHLPNNPSPPPTDTRWWVCAALVVVGLIDPSTAELLLHLPGGC